MRTAGHISPLHAVDTSLSLKDNLYSVSQQDDKHALNALIPQRNEKNQNILHLAVMKFSVLNSLMEKMEKKQLIDLLMQTDSIKMTPAEQAIAAGGIESLKLLYEHDKTSKKVKQILTLKKDSLLNSALIGGVEVINFLLNTLFKNEDRRVFLQTDETGQLLLQYVTGMIQKLTLMWANFPDPTRIEHFEKVKQFITEKMRALPSSNIADAIKNIELREQHVAINVAINLWVAKEILQGILKTPSLNSASADAKATPHQPESERARKRKRQKTNKKQKKTSESATVVQQSLSPAVVTTQPLQNPVTPASVDERILQSIAERLRKNQQKADEKSQLQAGVEREKLLATQKEMIDLQSIGLNHKEVPKSKTAASPGISTVVDLTSTAVTSRMLSKATEDLQEETKKPNEKSETQEESSSTSPSITAEISQLNAESEALRDRYLKNPALLDDNSFDAYVEMVCKKNTLEVQAGLRPAQTEDYYRPPKSSG